MHGTPHIVGDVMTRTVAAVGRTAGFKEIVRLMRDRRVSAVPVVDGGGRVVGVVSEADLLPKEEFRDSDPDRYTQLRRLPDLAKAGAVTAEELMTSPALTTRPDATLAQAARTMAHARVKRLPVVDEQGLLQGVVSRSDLLKVFLRGDEEIAEEVRREIVAYLFPPPASSVRVRVDDGAVRLVGRVRDTSLIPVAARLIRAVEGVVDVDFEPEKDTEEDTEEDTPSDPAVAQRLGAPWAGRP
ncbi:CBS domain-containing protein [Streptomyces pseudovenezuelae]|uniref:CBS domain-containing protein n=1 Tax=Streptomyces pseudovenezuelae TaxID=67350 RepID=UPI0036DFB457